MDATAAFLTKSWKPRLLKPRGWSKVAMLLSLALAISLIKQVLLTATFEGSWHVAEIRIIVSRSSAETILIRA